MNKNIYNRCVTMWIVVAALSSGACRKFVAVKPPDTLLSTETVFSSDKTAVAALMGMYSRAMLSQGLFLNGGNTVFPLLSSDEGALTLATPALQAFGANALQSDNNYIATLYGSAYNIIYNANTILENLPKSAAITKGTRRQLTGETLFLRALVYSRLVDLFGPVPLETSTDAEKNAIAPRAPVDDVYGQVIADLRAADSLLDTVYATSDATLPDRTRPNKWAARALLARVYLFRQRWQDAADAATSVIGDDMYKLEPSLDTVFRTYSREAIWQLQPVSPVMNTAEGAYFLPVDNPQTRPSYTLTSQLLTAFETGDRRRTRWVGQKQAGGLNYFFPAKYKVRTGPPYTEYNMVLRLAEIYLVRAEARARLGLLTDALRDLDDIRIRAGLAAAPDGLSQAGVLAAVMQERRIELFAEWGHRWSDLKRTGQIDTILPAEKPGWQHNAALYPLPQTELQRNPFISQNAGY